MVSQPAIVVLGPSGLETARQVSGLVDGKIHGLAKRVDEADILFNDTMGHLRDLFTAGQPIIGICAAGILIRAVGALAADKHSEPPVLAVSEDGASIVPLLGGHHGANALARTLADALGGHAAVTTAGDVSLGLALDAPPEGWSLANPADAKAFMAALLAGDAVAIKGNGPWLTAAGVRTSADAQLEILITDEDVPPAASQLVYHSPTLALGVGCERGCDDEELISLAERSLKEHGLAPAALACVCSIDVKADEPAVDP